MRFRTVVYFGVLLAACETTPVEETGKPDCTSGPVALSVGGTVNGTLSATDCADRGTGPYDKFTLSLNGSPVRFTVLPSNFPAAVLIEDRSRPTGSQTVAIEQDVSGSANLFLPGGTYSIELGTTSDAKGPYTLAVDSWSDAGCASSAGMTNIVAAGAAVGAAITANDCIAQEYYNDHYEMYMTAGRDYSISLDAPSGMSMSIRRRESATVLATQVANDGKINGFTFRPASTGWHDIGLVAFPQRSTKPYTLRIQ